ncbi:hypothetical protein NPIL_425881 [Nephila pilipes]|uniref:Uncharacterized protein n=1 Tax=Nephila pilipes TaxID=299642 RepID=A0A8X6T988_NEPPI|nr:hypothetical protein NPIL_425881 [Nephila pilipes]
MDFVEFWSSRARHISSAVVMMLGDHQILDLHGIGGSKLEKYETRPSVTEDEKTLSFPIMKISAIKHAKWKKILCRGSEMML